MRLQRWPRAGCAAQSRAAASRWLSMAAADSRATWVAAGRWKLSRTAWPTRKRRMPSSAGGQKATMLAMPLRTFMAAAGSV